MPGNLKTEERSGQGKVSEPDGGLRDVLGQVGVLLRSSMEDG